MDQEPDWYRRVQVSFTCSANLWLILHFNGLYKPFTLLYFLGSCLLWFSLFLIKLPLQNIHTSITFWLLSRSQLSGFCLSSVSPSFCFTSENDDTAYCNEIMALLQPLWLKMRSKHAFLTSYLIVFVFFMSCNHPFTECILSCSLLVQCRETSLSHGPILLHLNLLPERMCDRHSAVEKPIKIMPQSLTPAAGFV